MFGKTHSVKIVKDDHRRMAVYFDRGMNNIQKDLARVEKSMNDEPSDKKEIYARVEYLLYRAKMLDAEMNAFYTKIFTSPR